MDLSNIYTHPPRKVPDFTPNISHGIHKDLLHTLENLKNILCYIWTEHGVEFWIFPHQFTDEHIRCYGWHNDKWVDMYIPKEDIVAYY